MEQSREDWVEIGIDDDGTGAFLDAGSIIRDLETTLFSVWMKHVPPPGSRTYGELERVLKPAKKNLAPPDHVKQLVEIDLARGLSRTTSLVVCDKADSVLEAISFRFPDWTNIDGDSIINNIKGIILNRFPDAVSAPDVSFEFLSPKEHPKPDHVEISNRYRITNQTSDVRGKLKLEAVDV